MIIPLRLNILKNIWKLVEKYNIYEVDAIQITSAKYVNAEQFLTGDKRLHEIALKEGLNSIYLS